jgi:DNA-binding response OmpR family regulator
MGKTVIVREDDRDLAQLVLELLEEQRYSVLVVTTVEELLVEARRHAPCVTLVDGSSPSEFDLWWVGQVLAELDAHPVVFTAHASARRQFDLDPHGFVGVVSKPFDADELLACVNSICWEGEQAAAS